MAVIIVFLLLLAPAPIIQEKETGSHYNADGCPINITESKAYWKNPGRGRQWWGITFSFQNEAEKRIVAFKARVYGFSALYDLTDAIFVIFERQNLTPGRSDKQNLALFESPDDERFGFLNDAALHTFIVIEEVMFEDGTLWQRTDESYKDFLVEKFAPKIHKEDLVDPTRDSWSTQIF